MRKYYMYNLYYFGRVGLAGVRTRETEPFFHKPLVVVYTPANFERDPSNIRYHRNRMLKAAKEVDGKVQFALADSMESGRELQHIGADGLVEKGTVVIIHAANGQYYIMEDKFG